MSFSEFYNTLLELSRSYGKRNVPLKIDYQKEFDLIKIFGERMTALSKAKNGLDDITEFSYTVAEHHPFWNLLYQCSEISKITLDKWNSEFTKDELDEISWSIDELKNTCDKLKEKLDENS